MPKDTHIVYYNFADVLACAATISSLSVSSDDTEAEDSNNTGRQQPSNHRRQLSYNLRVFDINKYHNVKHKWNRKPFVVKSLRTLQLCRHQQRLDTTIHRARAKLSWHGCWNPENLVLTDSNSPFKNKIYMSINNIDKVPKGKKVEYLSGTWLSKVYVGDIEDLRDWVDHVSDEVHETHDWTGPRQWLSFYPTELQKPQPLGHSVIAFFIKVSD